MVDCLDSLDFDNEQVNSSSFKGGEDRFHIGCRMEKLGRISPTIGSLDV